MGLVPPPTRRAGVAVADQINLVPALPIAEIVFQNRSAARPLRQPHRQHQIPVTDTGQDNSERAVVVPPRSHPSTVGGRVDGRHPPRLPQPTTAVSEGGQVPIQGADQPERLPLPWPGVRTGPSGNSGELPPPTRTRPAVAPPRRVRKQMPLGGFPYPGGEMHCQGFGQMTTQMRRRIQMPVRRPLQPGT
ncbi:hypothetical protein Vau01_006860 [Virgisporangium aurantiacum]|uniref:Uncharacterized protein n=1 Tax=Virgisporangium aurantiacum TaxID=175570 RepID=A0A8J4DW81_9ACTN|nr:hypothetical protein Vau01_006860 [Virgisporangium aurantiacum]